MSEFNRTEFEKDFNGKIIEARGSLEALIATAALQVNELVAAKAEPDWTAIESVEQVEGLACGFYELKHNIGIYFLATRFDDHWRWNDRNVVGNWQRQYNEDLVRCFASYKLIRAFEQEPAAPAIPEEKKYHFGKFWDTPASDLTLQEIAGHEEMVDATREMARDFIELKEKVAAIDSVDFKAAPRMTSNTPVPQPSRAQIAREFFALIRQIDYETYAAIPGMKVQYNPNNDGLYRSIKKALQQWEAEEKCDDE